MSIDTRKLLIPHRKKVLEHVFKKRAPKKETPFDPKDEKSMAEWRGSVMSVGAVDLGCRLHEVSERLRNLGPGRDKDDVDVRNAMVAVHKVAADFAVYAISCARMKDPTINQMPENVAVLKAFDVLLHTLRADPIFNIPPGALDPLERTPEHLGHHRAVLAMSEGVVDSTLEKFEADLFNPTVGIVSHFTAAVGAALEGAEEARPEQFGNAASAAGGLVMHGELMVEAARDRSSLARDNANKKHAKHPAKIEKQRQALLHLIREKANPRDGGLFVSGGPFQDLAEFGEWLRNGGKSVSTAYEWFKSDAGAGADSGTFRKYLMASSPKGKMTDTQRSWLEIKPEIIEAIKAAKQT